jgi:hypothetical protein
VPDSDEPSWRSWSKPVEDVPVLTDSGARAVFRVLDARESLRIRRHGTDGGSWHDRLITTVVARVPRAVGAALVEAASVLPVGPGDYRYPVADLHLTIGNLDAAAVCSDHEDVATRLTQALTGVACAQVTVLGLGVSRHTIFAKAIAHPSLGGLRRRTRQAVGVPRAFWRPGDSAAFINLVRFRQQHGKRMVDLVRTTELPTGLSWRLDQVELVATDKVLSESGTTLLEHFPLGPQRRPPHKPAQHG